MDGMGGIEAARTLLQSGVDAVVIFITGIKEYVFEAFDVSAFHYLLKPIEEQKFMEVLGRAAEEAGKRKGQGEKQIFIRAKNHNVINLRKRTIPDVFTPIHGIKTSGIVLGVSLTI